MRRLLARLSLLGCLLLSPTATLAALAQSGVQLPPAQPTIPPDVMYALGQQGGLLNSISGRLEKIEGKIEGIQTDVTRMNTVGLVGGILLTALILPIVVYRLQRRFGGQPST
jgi:hypothetical protein